MSSNIYGPTQKNPSKGEKKMVSLMNQLLCNFKKSWTHLVGKQVTLLGPQSLTCILGTSKQAQGSHLLCEGETLNLTSKLQQALCPKRRAKKAAQDRWTNQVIQAHTWRQQSWALAKKMASFPQGPEPTWRQIQHILRVSCSVARPDAQG